MWAFYSILNIKLASKKGISKLSKREAASILDVEYTFAKYICRCFSKTKLGNLEVLTGSDDLTGAFSCEMKLSESLNINLPVIKPQVYASS